MAPRRRCGRAAGTGAGAACRTRPRLRRPGQQRRRRPRGRDAPARLRQGRRCRRCSAMPPRLPADAAQAHARARAGGRADRALAAGVERVARAGHRRPARPRRARAPPSGDIAAAIGRSPRLAARGAPVLAVDVPSGLDPDRGQPLGDACVVAEHTLALIGAQARASSPASGRDHAGHGLDRRPRRRPRPARAGRLAGRRRRDRSARAAAPPRRAQGQLRRRRRRRRRRRHGRRGAARRARRACRRRRPRLRRPARRRAPATLRARSERPELMLRPRLVAGRRRGGRAAAPWSAAAAAAMRCAPPCPACVGLAARLVLDADALNAVAVDTALRTLLARAPAATAATVLTPHPLEAARLLGTHDARGPGRSPRRRAARSPSATAPPSSSRARAASSPRPAKRRASTPPATPRSRPPAPATCSPAGSAAAGARGASAFDAATLAVVEHGAAAEPARSGRAARRRPDRAPATDASATAERVALGRSAGGAHRLADLERALRRAALGNGLAVAVGDLVASARRPARRRRRRCRRGCPASA